MRTFKFPAEIAIASIWLLWIFFGIGILGWALFVILDAFDVKKDAASWVQAVGSIAAIVAAFVVTNRAHELQRRASMKASLEAEVNSSHLAECAVYEAAAALRACRERTRAGGGSYIGSVSSERIMEVKSVLKTLLARQLSTRIVDGIFKVQGLLSEALAQIQAVNEAAEHRDELILDLGPRVTTIMACRLIIESEYIEVAHRAGITPRKRVS